MLFFVRLAIKDNMGPNPVQPGLMTDDRCRHFKHCSTLPRTDNTHPLFEISAAVYKSAWCMRGNTEKTCLPSMINEDQTGFISGCFIDENTRMVYDTIEYCKSHNKKGSDSYTFQGYFAKFSHLAPFVM